LIELIKWQFDIENYFQNGIYLFEKEIIAFPNKQTSKNELYIGVGAILITFGSLQSAMILC
jgi:hypothetical protein